MRFFLTCLICLVLSAPAFAQQKRVEDISAEIFTALEQKKFSSVEKQLNSYMDEKVLTRHGTDMTLSILDWVFNKIDHDKAHEQWTLIAEEWEGKSPDTFLQEFFNQILKHRKAYYFLHSDEWNELYQSQQRRHKETLANSYNRFLKVARKHPENWHIHTHLVYNFTSYKLTTRETNEHFQKAQQYNNGEIFNLTGYIKSLSVHALGRTDKMIEKGIETILRKYPNRNLSKPEYINPETKKEIEDTIFEITTAHMLTTARKYVEEAKENSPAHSLIPLVYRIIYDDIQTYYKDRPDKFENHPLSLKRKAVRNEIEQSYKI